MSSTVKATKAKGIGGDAKGRGRGSYASKACNMCRRKKVRCDESTPVCGACVASGREAECQYTGETARQPRTQAHFSAIKNYANALKQYANMLESMVEKCHREHRPGSPEGTTYLQLRPKDPFDGPETQDTTHESEASDSDEGSDISELCFPSQNLKLEDRHLIYYGSAAPFRYASDHPDTPDETSRTSRFSEINANPRERYVLMVDGVDPSHCNPYFDWSRHLPSQVPLDRKEHDRILDLLFKFFSCWGMRVVPTLFLRDMYRYISVPRHESPIKRSHYSPMLHNALLSVAAGFSDDSRVRDYKSRKCFADKAKRYIDEECAEPNVSVIHALSILSCFHSSVGEHALGYIYFGMSARISQALGLTVDCSDWVRSGKIAIHDMHDRNWAYWTTFSEDVCWSLYVGRDFCVPEPSDRHRIPVPFIDTDYDQIPWEYSPSKVPPQPNNLSRTFAASCELLRIARRVMDIVNALHSGNLRQVGDEMISSIDLKLHEWKSKLPPEVDITLANKNTSTPHRLMAHLTFHWIFILLHRPFFLRKKKSNSDKVIDHAKLCRTAAENVMDLVKIWRTLYTLRYVPSTIIQIVFAAGTIYIVMAVRATSGLRVAKESLRNFLSQAELCVQYLNEMGQSWKCASDIGDILRKLLQQQLKPTLEKRMVAIKNGELVTPTDTPPAQPSKASESPGLPSTPSRPSTNVPYTGYSSSSNAYTSPPQTPANESWLASYNNGIITDSNPLYPSSSTAPPAYNLPPTANSGANFGSYGGPDFTVMETAGFLAMADREAFASVPFIAPFHNEGFSMEDMEYLQQADDSPAMSWIQDDNMMSEWQDLDFASFQRYLGNDPSSSTGGI